MRAFSRIVHAPDEPPIERVIRPFQEFAGRQAAGGIVLFICAVAALIWANSPWASSYDTLWETHFKLGLGDFVLDKSLHFWINDAMMVVFFLLVGLEIKRALLVGELRTPRRAALPVVAALGV